MANILRQFVILLLTVRLCISCAPGEYLDENRRCMQCDISCNTCLSSYRCNTCYDQMYLIARANKIVCQVCYVINKGCDVCLTSRKCSRCLPGYLLQADNTCTRCDSYFPNCLLCSLDSKYCLSCASPYRMVNGECQIFVNSSKIENQNITNPKTISQNDEIFLTRCDQSEVYVNGKCNPSVPFCQTYSPTNGSCIECMYIFLLHDGYCLPQTLVTANIRSQNQQKSSKQNSSSIGSSNPISDKLVQPPNLGNLRNIEAIYCVALDQADKTKCLVCAEGYTMVDLAQGICSKAK